MKKYKKPNGRFDATPELDMVTASNFSTHTPNASEASVKLVRVGAGG